MYKDTFGDAVSAVLGAEYLGDGGGGDMLVCGLDGEVRGYRSREAGLTATTSAMSRLDVSAGGGGEARSGMAAEEMMGKDRHEETLVELNQRRQDLLVELKSYERNSAAIEQAGFRGETATGAQIPRDTKVRSRLEMNPDVGGGELVLATNNDSVIKAAILFGEAVFEEESRFVYFPSPSTEVRVPIRPPRDVAAELSIKALVSARASPTYHVFELEFAVPRFCMYAPADALARTRGDALRIGHLRHPGPCRAHRGVDRRGVQHEPRGDSEGRPRRGRSPRISLPPRRRAAARGDGCAARRRW